MTAYDLVLPGAPAEVTQVRSDAFAAVAGRLSPALNRTTLTLSAAIGWSLRSVPTITYAESTKVSTNVYSNGLALSFNAGARRERLGGSVTYTQHVRSGLAGTEIGLDVGFGLTDWLWLQARVGRSANRGHPTLTNPSDGSSETVALSDDQLAAGFGLDFLWRSAAR